MIYFSKLYFGSSVVSGRRQLSYRQQWTFLRRKCKPQGVVFKADALEDTSVSSADSLEDTSVVFCNPWGYPREGLRFWRPQNSNFNRFLIDFGANLTPSWGSSWLQVRSLEPQEASRGGLEPPQDLPKTPKIEAKILPKTEKFCVPKSRPKITSFFVKKSMIFAIIFHAFLTSLSYHFSVSLI